MASTPHGRGAPATRRDRDLVMTAAGKAGQWLKLVAPALLDRLIADAVRKFDES